MGMTWLRHRSILQVFAFTFGPIKMEACGLGRMTPRQWFWARIVMTGYTVAFALMFASIGLLRTTPHG